MKIKLSTVSVVGLVLAAVGFGLASSAQAAATGTPARTSASPPLVLDNVLVSPANFYPLVWDGYRDMTTVGYRINREANVTARVYNSAGSVIRKVVMLSENSGRHYWSWGGRKNDGTRVLPGHFRIQITATADRTQSATKAVTVLTGWRTATVTKSKGGYYVSSTATQRSSDGFHCYANRYAYFDETDLDCWGGAYAQANYHFDIAANAYNVSWSVGGVTGCCSEGTISKWGTRYDASDYRVSVKVTDMREYDVRSVTVTYSYKYRI